MSTDDLDQIARLFRLRESGALTQAEFEAEKARVLSARADEGEQVEEASEPEPVEAASYSEAEYQRADPHEAARYRRSQWPLVLVVLAAILAIGAGAGWYALRGDSTTAEREPAANSSSPTAARLPAEVAAAPSPLPEQDGASLYRWATSTEPLGVTPEFLIGKLGAPRRRDSSSLDFVVSGCDINYAVEGTAIAYIDAEVSASCTPSLAGLDAATVVDFPHATTLAQVEQKAGGLIIADCLEMCGNAADPSQYLFRDGPHADNWVNVAVKADPNAPNRTEKWAAAIRANHGLSPDAELPEQSYQCGTDAQEIALREIGPIRVSRVLFGPSVTKEKLTNCGADTN